MDDRDLGAYAYAIEKLGYVVSEMNRDSFTPDELEAWDEALAEWEQANPA